MGTDRPLLICGKCAGEGKYLQFGECFSCRGTGVMATYQDGTITFQGKIYEPEMLLPFTNTRGKTDIGKIVTLYNVSVNSKDPFTGSGIVDLNNIWYVLINTRTGGKTATALHISLRLSNALQLKFKK